MVISWTKGITTNFGLISLLARNFGHEKKRLKTTTEEEHSCD